MSCDEVLKERKRNCIDWKQKKNLLKQSALDLRKVYGVIYLSVFNLRDLLKILIKIDDY